MPLTTHPDYPAIKQLAASLYKNEGERGGVAVLVGAGFSRSAAKTPSFYGYEDLRIR